MGRCPDHCGYCDELILAEEHVRRIPGIDANGDAFVAEYHAECMARMIIGGLNHLRGCCSCCGGTEPPDPPELSRRDAARAACDFWWISAREPR